MQTVHPLDFVRVKQAMGISYTREASKRGKDLLQAKIVTQLVHELMPHLLVAQKPESRSDVLFSRPELVDIVSVGLSSGRVLSVSDGLVVQKINRSGDTVRHDASKLSAVVKNGDVVDILYNSVGIGVVSGLEIKGKGGRGHPITHNS